MVDSGTSGLYEMMSCPAMRHDDGNQWQSVAINGNQWHSVAISVPARPCATTTAISGNQWQSVFEFA